MSIRVGNKYPGLSIEVGKKYIDSQGQYWEAVEECRDSLILLKYITNTDKFDYKCLCTTRGHFSFQLGRKLIEEVDEITSDQLKYHYNLQPYANELTKIKTLSYVYADGDGDLMFVFKAKPYSRNELQIKFSLNALGDKAGWMFGVLESTITATVVNAFETGFQLSQENIKKALGL